MKKVGQVLLTIALGFFIMLFTWIIVSGIFFGKDIIYSFNPFLLVLFIALDIAISIFIYKKILPKIVKYKWLPVVLIVLFTILCIAIGVSLRLNPSWDMGRVFNMAVEYNQQGYITDTYLYEYQNNIAITSIFILIFKAFSLFGATDYITIVTVINAIMISLTVLCMYKVVNKVSGKRNALMFLIICLFTTPLYLYAAIYYTDTMSMFICSLFLMIYVYMRDEENKKKKILEQILLGLVFIIGFEVKITSSFVFIAILITGLLNGKYKELIKDFKFFIPSALIFFILWTAFVNVAVIPNKEKLNQWKVPITHWLWIGSVGNGSYNEEAYQYTYSFPTYDERNSADLQKLKESIKSYNIGSFIGHINEKINFTWADGTYFAPEKLRRNPVEKSILYEYVAGDGIQKDAYKYFPQTMHFAMLIFMLINAIHILRKKKYDNIYFTLTITILEIAVFLMIWENRSRYILTLVPIMIMLSVHGIEIISNKFKKGDSENEENISSNTNVL